MDKKKEIRYIAQAGSGRKIDTFSYRGWLCSDYFLKRAFAVVGHYLVAGLILWAGIMALIIFLALGFALR